MGKTRLRIWTLEALVATNLNEVAFPATVAAAYPEKAGAGVDPRSFAGNGLTDTVLASRAISLYGLDDPMAIMRLLETLPRVSRDELLSRRASVVGSMAARSRIRANREEGIVAGVLSPMTRLRTRDLLVAAGFSPEEDFGSLEATSACLGLGSDMTTGYDQLSEDLAPYDVEFVTMSDADVPGLADLLGADVVPFDD